MIKSAVILMRLTGIVYIAAFLMSMASSGISSEIQWHRVRWVDDGDTIVLSDGVRVRYLGVNTPEIDHEHRIAEPFGYESQAFNRSLVMDQLVRLEFDRETRDQYGRVLAYVFLKNGVFVNELLIAEGYGHCMACSPECRYDSSFLAIQKSAMADRKGIWKQFKDQEETYIGNTRSKKFHIRGCRYGDQTGKHHRRYFRKKWDAFWEGYSPCARCIGGK